MRHAYNGDDVSGEGMTRIGRGEVSVPKKPQETFGRSLLLLSLFAVDELLEGRVGRRVLLVSVSDFLWWSTGHELLETGALASQERMTAADECSP